MLKLRSAGSQNCESQEKQMQETAQEYKQRIFGYLAGNDPVKVQSATSKKLQGLIARAPSARLRKQPAPGKWSVTEILAHLADVELVVGYRIRTILGAPGTAIQAFDQDKWAREMNYGKSDARRSLERFIGLRKANLELLKSLSPAQWKYHGIHAERGEESIETIAKLSAGHDLNHLSQIERIVSQ
jgi:DinB family protein